MNRALALAVLCPLLALVGCVRYFPGTEIPDTSDTRKIRDMMEKYRTAMEAGDAEAIISMVSESYRDDFGTIQTQDDLDYAGLREVLPRRLSAVQDADLYMEVKRIDVKESEAVATYYYVWRYKVPTLTSRPQSYADLQQMWFRKVGDEWKIVRGL
jgi:ketosteroid isomerase-like protein